MQHFLWLVPALPLLGSIVLMLGTGRLSHRAEALIGVLSVGLAAVVAFGVLFATIGAYGPARRAARSDPRESLLSSG